VGDPIAVIGQKGEDYAPLLKGIGPEEGSAGKVREPERPAEEAKQEPPSAAAQPIAAQPIEAGESQPSLKPAAEVTTQPSQQPAAKNADSLPRKTPQAPARLPPSSPLARRLALEKASISALCRDPGREGA